MKTLIKNIHTLATFDKNGTELKDAWVSIEDNIIKGIGSGNTPTDPFDKVIDAKDMLVLPGFVNTHHHFYQSLFRAVPEVQDAKLFDWLTFLYEKWKYIDEEAVKVSTVIAILEMMKSGVTTTTDHLYLFPNGHPTLYDSEVEGAKLTGVRFYGTRGSMSLSKKDGGLPPDSVVQTVDEILKDYERVVNLYHDPKPYSMSRVALAPCSPFSVTKDLMVLTREFAEKHDLLIHTHLAETKDEEQFCVEQFGRRPVDYMEDLGWLSDRAWFAHVVHVSDADIKKLSDSRAGMAHCPSSNMRLGSGVAPIYKMKNTNMRIGLGVDGSSSNDTGNFLLEIRNAMLLQRVAFGESALTAREALKLATIGGASVLRMDEEIGSIEVGKAADIIGFNLQDRLEFAGGLSDPVAAIVFCDAKQVDFSMINGSVVIEDGRFVSIDEEEFIQKQNSISKKLLEW